MEPSLVAPLLAAVAEGGLAATLFELGGVVGGLALLARLAARLRFSPIPLYLVAGLAFGHGGLVPLGLAESFIETGSTIGVLLLLFMLGLEYTGEELSANLKAGWRSGAVDAGLNLVPGIAAGLLLGWGPVAALVLGGITYISSSGLAAKVLRDFEWLGNRETPAVLSVLVLEDLAMAAYLPIVAALLVGGSALQGALSLVVAVAAVSIALLLSLRYGGAVSRAVANRSDEVVLLSVLALVLLVAAGAEQLQVSAAIGAFLVGIALGEPVSEQVRSLLGPLRDLFAAIFFVFFGLQIDPATIPPVLGLALALALVTTVTKLATGWWAAKRIGVATRGRARAGTLLVARGEFSIVIAGIGVSAGLEPRLGPLAAAYVLITAVAGPVHARFSDPVVGALQAWWARRRPSAQPRTTASAVAPP